MMGL
jgi:hypothetical protein